MQPSPVGRYCSRRYRYTQPPPSSSSEEDSTGPAVSVLWVPKSAKPTLSRLLGPGVANGLWVVASLSLSAGEGAKGSPVAMREKLSFGGAVAGGALLVTVASTGGGAAGVLNGLWSAVGLWVHVDLFS